MPYPNKGLGVYPLAERDSYWTLEKNLVNPRVDHSDKSWWRDKTHPNVIQCANDIREAKNRGAPVVLFFGAHLVKNGLGMIVRDMMLRKLINHVGTNGAGVIHDWELAYQGKTSESVENGIATGKFGAWHETGHHIMNGVKRGPGFGSGMRDYMHDHFKDYPHANNSILMTLEGSVSVHPGIGYDIIIRHPEYDGSLIGNRAEYDFWLLCNALQAPDYSVIISVGSAIMAPQVCEKALSCINYYRLHSGKKPCHGHKIHVVDIQDGGSWDWTKGEPPCDNPDFYLRFCKSFSRMGGDMKYTKSDNRLFMLKLWQELSN